MSPVQLARLASMLILLTCSLGYFFAWFCFEGFGLWISVDEVDGAVFAEFLFTKGFQVVTKGVGHGEVESIVWDVVAVVERSSHGEAQSVSY